MVPLLWSQPIENRAIQNLNLIKTEKVEKLSAKRLSKKNMHLFYSTINIYMQPIFIIKALVLKIIDE